MKEGSNSAKHLLGNGQWLWLSWLSGRFQLLRSAVQIQSSAKFKLNNYRETAIIKKKRPGIAHLKIYLLQQVSKDKNGTYSVTY